MYTTEAFEDSNTATLLFSSAVSSPRGVMGRGAASARLNRSTISGVRCASASRPRALRRATYLTFEKRPFCIFDPPRNDPSTAAAYDGHIVQRSGPRAAEPRVYQPS